MRETSTKVVSDFCRRIEVTEGGCTQEIQLNIWDAAGDASVHNLAHLFLRDVQVGILVYSINSKKSFEKLEEWLDHLEENNEKFILFLVGNKSDLTRDRAVPYTFGQEKKRNIETCVMFKETSAYNDVASI